MADAISSVGKLNLEGLMTRAEILFSSGYKFRGTPDLNALENSFNDIVKRVDKFHFQMDFQAQNQFEWQSCGQYNNAFRVIRCDNLDDGFNQVSADAFTIRSESGNFPMNMVVLTQESQKDVNEFVICLLCSHEYSDARSSATVFDLIVKHYNGTVTSEESGCQQALEAAEQLQYLDAQTMIGKLKRDTTDHQRNLEELGGYAVADEGQHAVSIGTFGEMLPKLRQRKRPPANFSANIADLVGKCRKKYPEVTKNAVITAALHKAIYQINRVHKGAEEQHLISGKMLSDLLTPEQRETYLGNYIAFVPFSTPGEIAIEDMAKQIHDRILEMRDKQLDLSCFELVEFLAEENAMGKDDEPLSYIITNWNNYLFMADKHYLHDCESLAHMSGVNVDPLDDIGGSLINRAVVVINMSFDDDLYVSMFPSLRDDTENHRLMAEMKRVITTAG